MGLQDLAISLIKIAAVLAYVYGFLWVLGRSQLWMKLGGIVVAFLVMQAALTVNLGGSPLLNTFDAGLLFQACTMTMVALGVEPDLWFQRAVQPGPIWVLWDRRIRRR